MEWNPKRRDGSRDLSGIGNGFLWSSFLSLIDNEHIMHHQPPLSLGYLKYGAAIEGSITLNLPQDEMCVLLFCLLVITRNHSPFNYQNSHYYRLARLVKVFMVFAIFGSYTM